MNLIALMGSFLLTLRLSATIDRLESIKSDDLGNHRLGHGSNLPDMLYQCEAEQLTEISWWSVDSQ